MKQYANLHFHSTHSDGVYTPQQLVDLAVREGYHAIALADHDTVTGNTEAAACAASRGLSYIFAAEFNASSRDFGFEGGFHIVGMHFDPAYPAMREYLAKLSESETHQTKTLFHRGVANGFIKDITWEEVLSYNAGISWLCNEHVFRAMKAKGLLTDREYPAFFANVYGPHRYEVQPLHEFLPPKQLIPLIHAAGGIAVLAHPHEQGQYMDALCACGLDGVEVWHSMLTAEERIAMLRYAIDHDLYVSGGTDHEGEMGGQYDRLEDPRHSKWWLEPLTMGTQALFFDEILHRRLAPRAQRLAILDELIQEVQPKGDVR